MSLRHTHTAWNVIRSPNHLQDRYQMDIHMCLMPPNEVNEPAVFALSPLVESIKLVIHTGQGDVTVQFSLAQMDALFRSISIGTVNSCGETMLSIQVLYYTN